MCSARTQTIHMVKQPFISRFRCDAARTLGFPPFLFDGGGGFRVLYDSHTLRKTMATRKTGTKRPMIIAASRRRVTGEVLVVAKRQDWIPRWRRPRLSLYACGAHDCKWNPRRKHEAAPVATQARGVIRHVLRALLLEATATRSPGLRLDATPCRRFGRRGQRSLLKALRISSRRVLCYFIFPMTPPLTLFNPSFALALVLLSRSSMTMLRRCATPRTRHTRASARQSLCGLSCACPTLALDTSTSCTTSVTPSARSSTTGSSRKDTRTPSM
jgi:hypothetical protein